MAKWTKLSNEEKLEMDVKTIHEAYQFLVKKVVDEKAKLSVGKILSYHKRIREEEENSSNDDEESEEEEEGESNEAFENFMNRYTFLSLRFYVKSILAIFRVSIIAILTILQPLNFEFWHFCAMLKG